jgi:hypothetical protein
MAKANLIFQDGTKVNIEGTAEEVDKLLSRFSIGESAPTPKKYARGKKKVNGQQIVGAKTNRKGPQTLIEDLASENYFKSKRTINDIQNKLEEKGHIYALTSISAPLLRLTRKKVLRRLKEQNGWVYVS